MRLAVVSFALGGKIRPTCMGEAYLKRLARKRQVAGDSRTFNFAPQMETQGLWLGYLAKEGKNNQEETVGAQP